MSAKDLGLTYVAGHEIDATHEEAIRKDDNGMRVLLTLQTNGICLCVEDAYQHLSPEVRDCIEEYYTVVTNGGETVILNNETPKVGCVLF